MNPQSPETAGLNLPPPVERRPAQPQAIPEAAPAGAEQTPLPGQADPTRVQQAAPAVPTIPLPLPSNATAAGAMPADPAAAATPAAADDGDLIEKEWVNKAKEIVRQTKENPYEQSRELNLFKADYMKKRYNKTIKLSE